MGILAMFDSSVDGSLYHSGSMLVKVDVFFKRVNRISADSRQGDSRQGAGLVQMVGESVPQGLKPDSLLDYETRGDPRLKRWATSLGVPRSNSNGEVCG